MSGARKAVVYGWVAFWTVLSAGYVLAAIYAQSFDPAHWPDSTRGVVVISTALISSLTTFLVACDEAR